MAVVRLAVFTNQFPSRVSTFFARDMQALVHEKVELDVFPIYPLDTSLWGYVPDVPRDCAVPRERVHHISLGAGLSDLGWSTVRRLPRFVRDFIMFEAGAVRYGVPAVAKTAYAAVKAWAWAQRFHGFDHILAYLGSYAASCAYLYHRLTDPSIPFSMFVRADADLYRTPLDLARKMLYADNVFLISEFNREYIRSKYNRIFPLVADKIHVHYSGLDLNEIRFQPDGRPPRNVLAVGRFDQLKGFPNLLRAVHALHRGGLVVHLELVGAGEQEGELRALVSELGLVQHVIFRGWLTPHEVLEAMRQATVLVHAPIALDAMPNVIKEAMAVGTPVIGSQVAGIPELLDSGRCGILVPPKEIEALARAIEALVTDASLRARYAHAARLHVERHFDVWLNGRRLAARLRNTLPSGGRS